MLLRKAAVYALHQMGGLAVLRYRGKRRIGIPVFHAFTEQTRPNVEAFCRHVARNFTPVPISMLVSGQTLPDNAITVTVDDGYCDFLHLGHPIFRHHRIPVTLYAVSGFAAGRLWLWPDQIVFALRHTPHRSIRINLEDGHPLDLVLTSAADKAQAATELTEALKLISNERRLQFMSGWAALSGVELPPEAPPEHSAMTWEELRAVSSEGVEVGCHTATHPILSRIPARELEGEIRGAKEEMEERIRLPVRHFCYPNGRPIDIDGAAVSAVQSAGFLSAVTCSWGFNRSLPNPFELSRLPLDSTVPPSYQAEILAGLHL